MVKELAAKAATFSVKEFKPSEEESKNILSQVDQADQADKPEEEDSEEEELIIDLEVESAKLTKKLNDLIKAHGADLLAKSVNAVKDVP